MLLDMRKTTFTDWAFKSNNLENFHIPHSTKNAINPRIYIFRHHFQDFQV